MIELTNLSGETISLNPKSITAIRVDVGGWTAVDMAYKIYCVKESYEEVLQKMRGDNLETK